ncbi:hypothetical protein LSCM4_08269 [Leishmania orientalis]|uniref:Uncharacterized protein n=1 Tax=Leishmania orientalis TaxID=2249476 RepID=A0A836KYX0_9TRYP|nr:hypothetical protein LSCM4_08269 [Leishmania orientalis]
MPTKEYIQLLQRLFVHFKRNSGRNVPQGVSQIALVDDDDLTRWFVQLLYKDENNADFYVSLELVFSEDGEGEDGVVGGAWDEKANIGGMASAHRSASRHAGPSTSASMLAAATMTAKSSVAVTHAANAAPHSAAAASPRAHRHHTMTTSTTTPPAQPSSAVASEGEGDAACSGYRGAAPRTGTCFPSASKGARMSDRSAQQQRSDEDADPLPTATTPQPNNEPQRRLLALEEAELLQVTSEGDMAQPEVAAETGMGATRVRESPQQPAKPLTDVVSFYSAAAAAGSSRRFARMPLVFVVAPRLIASFIHHGAICSLELMSQHWELTPESIVLLLIALSETLNPFAGDGRVSVDDAERMESRRETAAAAGIGGGGASTFAGAYSEEEHQLGMEYIRRAHPHLFRRYVSPLAARVSAVSNGTASLAVRLESKGGNLGASAPSSNRNSAAAAATGGVVPHRDHRNVYLDSGSAVGSESVVVSASPHGGQTATATPSCAELETGHGRVGGSGALEPHVLGEVSHLNTAVYDALVSIYAPSSLPSPAPLPPTLSLFSLQQQRHPTEATKAPVVMLLDSPSILADAEGVQLFQSGVRGVQRSVLSTTVAADDRNNTEDSSTPDVPADGDRDGATREYSSSALPSWPAPLQRRAPSSASSTLCIPATNAERVSRARPPPLSRSAHAPAHPHRATAKTENAQQQHLVAELWIPFAMPPSPPSAGASSAAAGTLATTNAEGSATTQTLLLSEAGMSREGEAAPFPLEVRLIGDAGEDVQQARVACVLRNMRVSATAGRKLSNRTCPPLTGSDDSAPTPHPRQQPSTLRFLLQSSTAPSPTGDVRTCRIPHGLTLHCANMYLYGHLHVFGSLVLENCVFVGSLTTEGLASVQISRTHLALTPDDRLLQRQQPYGSGLLRRCCSDGRSPSCQRSSSTASPGTEGAAVATDKAAATDGPGSAAKEPPPPPPALFYAQRRECVLVLDFSRVEMSEGTHISRLMPDVHAAAAARQSRRSSHEAKVDKCSGETSAPRGGLGADDADADGGSSVSDGRISKGGTGEGEATAVAPSLAAMMTVLRSLILVSNQGRLRLVRCTVHPGRNTERTIFAEQDAIVDMAYCTVTAAISSAVSVQGCRAYLEHCFFEGTPTTTAAVTSAVLSAEAAAAAESVGDGVNNGGDHSSDSGSSRMQQHPPPPIRVNDTTRCTGLNVELGGTLTARHCTARHLYFAFCVIAHSVAHFYRCHAEDVVNGFTVDASAATLDSCSAHTNHVGAFVLRKAKCILTDDSCGSFPRRCSLLGEAHETACRAVTRELQQKQQVTREGVLPPAVSESLWSSAAAVAERTARVALLARRHYAERLPRSDTLSDAAPAIAVASHAPHGRSPSASEMPSPRQPLGFFGGRFSLEVRDAALKATGVTLMNARDTSVYAYEDSSVELVECVLWSTAEAEEAANAAAATVAAALGPAESSNVAVSATTLKLTCCGADGSAISPLRSGSPRQRSCGIKVVHAGLKARRCLMAGYSFGFAAIQSAQAELQECMVVNAINGYTIDHSQCRLRHCGADTSHVGLFALNGSHVEADSTPHVVGVSSCGRTPPPLICGGVPAVFCGDVYGVESQSSELHCTGITVLRGRDSGFNAYNGSVLRLSKCLVDMSPTDAASYVFRSPSNGGGGGTDKAEAPDGMAMAADGKGGGATEGKRGSLSNRGDGAGTRGLWTRHLHLDIGLAEEEVLHATSSDVDHAHHRHRLPASALRLSDRQGGAATRSDEGCEDGKAEATRPAAPAAAATSTTATPPSAPSSAGLATPIVRTSGVKVWSGSQCHAQDTEVRCVTFGFASLGPETLLNAHHCTAKHVVNGFTSDGGALQLTKCSASSNHVGVYILSHAHCIVRRGSYAAKKYGIECRSGVLSLQGHVKVYGFSRIGMYLYDGAHCEADPDCVLDIHAQKHASPGLSVMSSAAVATAAAPVPGLGTTSASLLQLPNAQQQQQPPVTTASATSLCSPEDAANVSDLLPACIALDEATAHLPQAVLGGGARCGVTCGDGATGFIGKCIVYECSLVGVNVFYGAHLTLANALLQCARQYAVVVHVGGVCRITQSAESDETDNADDGREVGGDGDGEAHGAGGDGGGGDGGLRGFLRRHSPGAAVSGAVRYLQSLTSHVVAAPWRVVPGWALRRGPSDGAAAAAPGPVEGDGGSRSAVLSGAMARSFASGSVPYASTVDEGTPRTPAVAAGAPPTLRHAPSRRRGETRSAVALSSSTAATASPVTIGGRGSCGVGGALPAESDDEIGGPRTVPLTGAAWHRLKWLCREALVGTRLSFRLNRTLMPDAAVGADGPGPKPGSTAVGVEERQTWPLAEGDSSAAAPHDVTVPPPAAASAVSHVAPMSVASAITSVLPPIRPAIFGSCVVRGTCTMERVLLRPTNPLPRLFAECRCAGDSKKQEGGDDCNSPTQQLYRDSSTSANGTSARETDNGDSEYASPLLATTSTIKAFLAASGAAAAASARAADRRAALPSVRVLNELMRQPPAVHVYQQGVLNLTDCIVDVSLSTQPRLRGWCTGQLVSAVVACEGPYAKLHCDYVRVVRGEGGNDENSSVIGEADGAVSGAARPLTSSAFTRPSISPAPSSLRRDATVIPAADVATVPLLLVSLVDGAQCTLHMVGTSLEDWPYCAYTAAFNSHHGNDADGDPMTVAEKADSGAPRESAGGSGADVVPLTSAHNAGVMLRAAGDTLADVTYANIAAILASQRSQVRLAHCTVTGMVPIILSSGSYASLTSCRVVGGMRAGPAAAAIQVKREGAVTLFRSSVWTLSQGPAVECADSRCVQAIDSEELTLGTAAGSAEEHGDSSGADEGGAEQP